MKIKKVTQTAMELLWAIHALMSRGSFFITFTSLRNRIPKAIRDKGGNALLCCKTLA